MSSSEAPLAWKEACWPDSLPAMLTRSTMTPGIVRSTAQGSRAWGMRCSSSRVSVVFVPSFFASTTGVSAVTSTVSSIVATLIVKSRSTFWLVTRMTLRVNVEKPDSATASS